MGDFESLTNVPKSPTIRLVATSGAEAGKAVEAAEAPVLVDLDLGNQVGQEEVNREDMPGRTRVYLHRR